MERSPSGEDTGKVMQMPTAALGMPRRPLIADANAIAEDVVYYTKHELEVGRGFSRLTLLTGLGACRVFVPSHIPGKVEARLEVVARHRKVDVDQAYATYARVHRALLNIVDLPPITVAEDPRVLSVLQADEEDGPVAQLAVLLAPGLLLTKDHHLLDAGLGVAKWADALGLVQQMVAVDSTVYSGGQLMVLMLTLGGAGVREAGRLVARSPVLIGLGGAVLFMLLTDWRDAARARLTAAGSAIKDRGAEALERSADAFERRNAAERRLQALVVEPGSPSLEASMARLLAVRAQPMPVSVISERLGANPSAVKRALAHPAFIGAENGVTVGQPLSG